MMSLYAIQLECLISIWGILILLVDAFKPIPNKRTVGYLAAGFVAVALLYSFAMQPVPDTFFHGMFRLDPFALYFKRLFLLALAAVLLMAAEFSPRNRIGRGRILCAADVLRGGNAADRVRE